MYLPNKYKMALELMQKDVWYTLDEIYEFIEENVDFTDAEEEIDELKYVPRWQVNVRSVLFNMKKDGWVIHQYRIPKGTQGNKETIPTKYKFCSTRNTDIQIRPKGYKTKYTIAIKELLSEANDEDGWYTLDEIFDYILRLDIIEEEEWERSKPNSPMTIWEHKVYSSLNHMKGRNQVEHQPRISKDISPTGKYIPPKYRLKKQE